VKIAVAGKGGAGKTTVSGTIARELARRGHTVLALDADTNPMLGISLGVGPEETYRLLAVRQGLDEGSVEHKHSVEELMEDFATDAPDGVRLVVALREGKADTSCTCCGVTPGQLLAGLEGERRTIICDLEAGIAAIVQRGQADLVLVVTEPSAKSIDVARRAAGTASSDAEVMVIANRVRDDDDLDAIRAELGEYEIVVVPEDPAIVQADRDGRAPIDTDPDAPAVKVLIELADRLGGREPVAA
jgi:CO dehydrogenase maturation factor